MKYLILLSIICLISCTADGEKNLAFECEQNTGDACYRLGLKKNGEEAVALFKRGCELGSKKACEKMAK